VIKRTRRPRPAVPGFAVFAAHRSPDTFDGRQTAVTSFPQQSACPYPHLMLRHKRASLPCPRL